jgi:acyl-CoA reductase-like NAD-dependent aldehyde dehydrogenase
MSPARSADVERAVSVAQRLEPGYSYINHHGPFAQDNHVRFGGLKQRGLGRQLGVEGVLEFVDYLSLSTYG